MLRSPIRTRARLFFVLRFVSCLVPMVIATTLMSAAVASAQPGLDFSDPTDGETLATPPVAVTLVFGQTLDPAHSRITVTGPRGEPAAGGEPVVAGLTASVRFAFGSDGPYAVDYDVMTQSGVLIRNKIHFTVTAKENRQAVAGAAAPAQSASDGTPAQVTASPTSSSPANIGHGVSGHTRTGMASWFWPLLAAVIALAIIVIAVVARRRTRA
jgi:copper resistance protein C